MLMVFVAWFADDITIHEPVAISFANMLVSPNADFFLRTDKLGRDIFSRIVYSARTALLFVIYASVIGSTIGLVIGVDLAYFGSTSDFLFQRVMDVFMAFLLIILALAIVSIFGGGTDKVILAITIPFIAIRAVVRSNALAIRKSLCGCRPCCGFSYLRIILWHMVPNLIATF